MNTDILQYIIEEGISYKQNISLSALTGMNQDGMLPLVVYPQSQKQLKKLIAEIKSRNLSYDILGGLSNTYLCSTYSRDVVIFTIRMKDVRYEQGTVFVDSGYSLTKISRELSSKGITGYEGFVGIPGTIGAAAINNSGALGSSIHSVVKSVRMIDEYGVECVLKNKDLCYSTRSSILKGTSGYFILEVELDITQHDDLSKIEDRLRKNTVYRKKVVDGKRKSLGTVFVASTMIELQKRHKIALTFKKIINAPLKMLFHSQELNKYMDFLFLGHPELAKYCDRLNRFAWDKNTKETDFFNYIDTMQRLADNKLKLEIEIRK